MGGYHNNLGAAATVLAGVADDLSQADITFGNLEQAVTNGGSPWPEKTWTFRSPPEDLQGLYQSGFDIVSLANNHALDYGRAGFEDTLEAFADSDLLQVGGGPTLADAWTPRIIELADGTTVAFLAFSEIGPAEFAATDTQPGVAYTNSIADITAAVAAAAVQADYTLVSMHWGIENEPPPTERQVSEGRAIIDAGADVVLGGHPHIIQGIEFYGGGLINYSFGNFVFSPGADTGNDTYILHLTLTPDGVVDVAAVPVRLHNAAPQLAEGATLDRLLAEITTQSAARGTTVTVSAGRALLTPPA
jgi:poly-gamma-glutamate synthesis protein (capsule biosynthesis protein)